MCKLTFDYDWADTNWDDLIVKFHPSDISNEEKQAFEDLINLKYKGFCQRINDVGGKILVGYSIDGTSILRAVLSCEADLHREIHDALGIE